MTVWMAAIMDGFSLLVTNSQPSELHDLSGINSSVYDQLLVIWFLQPPSFGALDNFRGIPSHVSYT